ncbi:MAG: hypothetical protein K2Y27_16830 [Xanthobacteraceae bacterium]|nr:hypothetical protein [Xanthobacteraceae bacterium]
MFDRSADGGVLAFLAMKALSKLDDQETAIARLTLEVKVLSSEVRAAQLSAGEKLTDHEGRIRRIEQASR